MTVEIKRNRAVLSCFNTDVTDSGLISRRSSSSSSSCSSISNSGSVTEAHLSCLDLCKIEFLTVHFESITSRRAVGST